MCMLAIASLLDIIVHWFGNVVGRQRKVDVAINAGLDAHVNFIYIYMLRTGAGASGCAN